MPLRRSVPLTFSPSTLSDAVDGTPGPRGAMAVLSNLIPDRTTKGVFVPRPASVQVTSFPGFSSPDIVSGLLVVGDVVYGLVASARNAGKDEPFAYNLATGLFLTVAGITAGNSPTTQPSVGDWVPPILAQVGSRIVVTHPGFPGGATKFGWFDVSGASFTVSGTVAIGNPVIGSIASTVAVQPGYALSGTGVPAGATVVSTTATSITMSAPATASGAGTTITVTGGGAGAPRWAAGDTDRNPLPGVPVGVAQFTGRAYFALGLLGIVYSDPGAPCRVSNATAVQALTSPDGLAITALGTLGVTAPLTGGIVQGLIAFAGVTKMYQILGDQALDTLSFNALQSSSGSGTLAPLSIVPTEQGLTYVSPSGLRDIDFNGRVSPVIGHYGAGIAVPFVNGLFPSRIAGGANSDTLRLSVTRGDVTGNPAQEFWLDLSGGGVWTGPHTFPAAVIQPWRNTFVLAPVDIPGSLWTSDSDITLASTFDENGTGLTWVYQPVPLPDADQMAEIALIEMTLAAAIAPDTQIQATASDITGELLDTTTVTGVGGFSIWGQFLWGAAPWTGAGRPYRQYAVNWNVPLVFKQLVPSFTGASNFNTRVGDIYMRYQILGYKLQQAG